MEQEENFLGSLPELKKLWRAVIELTLHDANSLIIKSRAEFERRGKADEQYLGSIHRIENQIKTPWFEIICEYAEIHQDRVLQEFQLIKDRHRFNEIVFRGRSASYKILEN